MKRRKFQDTTPGQAAKSIAQACELRPALAIVLGSGFGGVTSLVEVGCKIAYSEIPGFPTPAVAGHAGEMVLGHISGVPVVVLNGRAHYYEGHSMQVITFPVRVLAALGVRALLLTNAAGGIRRSFVPGDFMVLADHINLMGANPLRGVEPVDSKRFVDLSQTYDPALRRLLRKAGRGLGLRLREGVYLAVSGPSYETPAEIRAFARLGADAVGMSTVPEAVVARHCGLEVAGVSCITNCAAGLSDRLLSHGEVLACGASAAGRAKDLVRRFVELGWRLESR